MTSIAGSLTQDPNQESRDKTTGDKRHKALTDPGTRSARIHLSIQFASEMYRATFPLTFIRLRCRCNGISLRSHTFGFYLSFAFELVDKPIYLLAIKVGDLVLSGSFGPWADPWQGKLRTPKVKNGSQFSFDRLCNLRGLVTIFVRHFMQVLDILEAASIICLTFTHSRGSTEASTAGPILTSGQLLLHYVIVHLGPNLILLRVAASAGNAVMKEAGLLLFLSPMITT